MKKKRTVLTTAEQIVTYWEEAGPSELDMGCDWADALDHCWRCGVKRSLQRCHIIPHQDPHNGPDVPENLVLVCSWCHKEAPCCDDPNAMWEWIKRTRSDVAGSIWAARVIEEMERQTGKTRDVLFQGIDYLPTEFWNLYQDIRAKRTGLHPGDFVTTAAWACIETLRGLAARRQSITSAVWIANLAAEIPISDTSRSIPAWVMEHRGATPADIAFYLATLATELLSPSSPSTAALAS